jgi:hypothetical protein
MLSAFQRHPGLTLGSMAAVGAAKVGAILWETTFSTWPLLHVLLLPLMGGAFAFGVGAGHDRLPSAHLGRRLGATGLLVLAGAGGWSLLGPPTPISAWAVVLPLATALVGIHVGRNAFPSALRPSMGQEPSQSHVGSG